MVLIHAKDDKPNVGTYIEVTVFDDMPFKDQIKAAMEEGGMPVKEEPVEEKESTSQEASQQEENDKKKEEGQNAQ